MNGVANPLLLEVNTRARVAELTRARGKPCTLDDIPDAAIDRWAADGFDWIWLLGVWQTGAAGRRISVSSPEWRAEYRRLLPDFEDSDVIGSCFAVTSYSVDEKLGGEAALARFRERLHRRRLRLMLDFVPNHTALDHPWAASHPEFYIAGTEDDLAREPQRYCVAGGRIYAHGRDPYFPAWPDTLQLNYACPALQRAMQEELAHVAGRCDGVRCDMAMLMLPEVFERTWGKHGEPFWPGAIARIRASQREFVFLAEAYWGLEWTLQQQGFDYTYDKILYDRLRQGSAGAVRDHLAASLDYQRHLARFLENHDEPRAAEVFAPAMHRAAAVIAFLVPGLRLFHDGQLEGRRIRTSVHLGRGAAEQPDPELQSFYSAMIRLAGRESGHSRGWSLVECVPAWPGNWTWTSFVCFGWASRRPGLLVTVNYSSHQGQCFVRLPIPGLAGRAVRFTDLLGSAVYERSGDDLAARGLYLDLPAWGYHAFEFDLLD